MIAFIRENLEMPVMLIGMMGTGKSRLGRELSRILNLEFLDSDNLIEAKAGCAVAEIFERFGEERFRAAEKNTMMELAERKECIVATGGGAVTNPEVLAAIRDNAISIWVQSDLDTILKRVEKNENRPMLANKDKRQALQDLMIARQPLYSQADISVKTVEGSIHESVETILKELHEYLKKGKS